jgi:hypothetical protein
MRAPSVATFTRLLVVAFTLALSAAQNSVTTSAQGPPSAQPSAVQVPAAQAPQGDASTLAGAGGATAGVGVAEPHSEVNDEVIPRAQAEAMNVEIRAAQAAAQAGKPRPFVPVLEGAPARESEESQPTEAAPSPESQTTLPLAPNDLSIFSQHDITSAEVSTSQRSTIMEPTAINIGNTVFYTANWFAAKSADGGATFTYVNPYTFFPSVNGGFCCDQVTAYAPNQDMAIWGLQYVNDANTNTLRIARAIGSAGVNSNNWLYYDFTPQNVGFPNGVWFDYPSMTVAGASLYVSSNAFLVSNNTFTGNVVMRISLAELAAGSALNFSYFRSNIGTERFTEGAGSTIYWAGFSTTTQMRIHRWTEGSNTIFWDNVNLSAFNYLNRNGSASSPDGTNWAARADSRPTAAYVANGVIGVMWTARQGTGRPKPYTVHARFSESTRALISQADIWNANYAWMYPAVSPNPAGNLGGTLQIGGDTTGTFAYPGTQLWITDDVTGASTTVGAVSYVSAGNDGPNNNGWGDYFSVRRHKTHPNTWVATSHTLQGGGNGSNVVPKYFWFGRVRDAGTPAGMTSPTPGSTLSGANVTFNWNAGSGVTQYWLDVGTGGVGTGNIYSASTNTSTSVAVTGLPLTGSTVYVRLWSLLSSGWQYNDYTYKAATITCTAAAMTTPTPGSTLPSTSQTFTWSANPCAAEYWLSVGTGAAGAGNIFDGSTGSTTSRLVSGVPNTGVPLRVRLWSRVNGSWVFVDYTYTSYTVVCTTTAMSSPTPGSTLTGATQTFTWNGNNCATEFWLGVGTTGPGSANIFNASTGKNMSVAVGGLPRNGSTVYVRLWTLSGMWTSIDYTYTAYTPPIALLQSPANLSLLAGPAATFAWSAGTGVTQYWLSVGTMQGGSNIFDGSTGTARSATVTGLPTASCSSTPAFTSPTAESILSNSSVTFNWSNTCTGSTVWVRIWSRIGSVWDYADYSMFTSGYKLQLGRTPNGNDLFNGVQGLATSSAVTGLPTNASRVYASLYYLSGGAWKMLPASFVASGSVAGFSQDFNTPGQPAGWEAHAGAWLATASGAMESFGLANNFSSASYNSGYGTVDYTVVMRRDGAASLFSNQVLVRGDVTPLATGNRWQNGYSFQYTSAGEFSVWKLVSGSPIAVQNWAASSAIVQGANWNTLRVQANGGTLSFRINGTVVWTGTDTSLTVGRVGFGYFDAGGFRVDSATLSTTLLADEPAVSAEQAAINEAAQAAPAGTFFQAPSRKQ